MNRMDWFDNIWGLRRDPEPETAPMDGDIFVGLHICTLPTYWTPHVAVGTTYTCPKCKRAWWLNEKYKWQSEVEE